MILDERLEFADATSVAASAGTALIGDVIDREAAGLDAGQTGVPVYLVITCSTSIITSGSAGTIQFKLVSDAAAAIATDGTATEHILSHLYVTDGDDANELDAGATILVQPLPSEGVITYERYLGILAVVATTTVSAGAINAFLTLDPAVWKSYADASN